MDKFEMLPASNFPLDIFPRLFHGHKINVARDKAGSENNDALIHFAFQIINIFNDVDAILY